MSLVRPPCELVSRGLLLLDPLDLAVVESVLCIAVILGTSFPNSILVGLTVTPEPFTNFTICVMVKLCVQAISCSL